jgi:hypothetical protein
MYLLTNQWVNLVTRGTTGFACTFHTMPLEPRNNLAINVRIRQRREMESKIIVVSSRTWTRKTISNALPV